ncbi:hypothetical protein GGF32_002952 [Allomyces javanicus]|nr:hypothetical protein GGF32_002952 [Allomyces javanicus]
MAQKRPTPSPLPLAQSSAQAQADSLRFYDSCAILDIVKSASDLVPLAPQTHAETIAIQQALQVADTQLTPNIVTWLYASIGIAAQPQHEVDRARQIVLQTMTALEATLAVQANLLPNRFSLADVTLAITIFPAYKNLFDPDTIRRFPFTTKWFFACVHNPLVQRVYDLLQASQVAYEPKREARKRKVTIDDYQLIKVLGKGCMGKVLLVRHKRSSNLYALKSISKSSVIVHKELNHTLAERKILSTIAQIQHPFLIQCHNAFTSESELFLVLDFVSGGDIATQLAKFGRFTLPRVRLYAAEIALGLFELHRLQILYRDLKPENVLLDSTGHIVLTDFGLSKMFRSSSTSSNSRRPSTSGGSGGDAPRTNTFAGTAEYLAPEILRNEEYSFEVDWWSFGTLAYEMLAGVTPFWADNHSVMYQRVLEDPLEFPDDMPADARSFLAALLERNPRKRLGAGPTGPNDLKRHPFFAPLKWDDVYHKRVPVPYAPEVRSATDLSNFEECFTSMSPRLSPPSHDLSASLQDYFNGYSWVPQAPIGSLSRSFRPGSSMVGAGGVASSLYGSSLLARTPQTAAFPSSGSTAPAGADDMDLDSPTPHGANAHHDDDEIDLDLTDMAMPPPVTAPGGAHASAAAALAAGTAATTSVLSPLVGSPAVSTHASPSSYQLTLSGRVKKPPTSSSAASSAPATAASSPIPSARPSLDDLYQYSPYGKAPAAWAAGATLASPTPSRPGTPTNAAGAVALGLPQGQPNVRAQTQPQASAGAQYWPMFPPRH